jgi:putative FmdB family regulatory protein
MPTYAFRCPQGHQFDHFFRKMSDATQTLPCPTCGQEAIRQMSGGAGLVFKGSGFYATDYKRKNGDAPSESKSSEGKSSEGKSSEGKPASDTPAPAPATPPKDAFKKSE